jgi:hypothetical protein
VTRHIRSTDRWIRIGDQIPTPTETVHFSNQGPLGSMGTSKSDAIFGAIDRGYSPPRHFSFMHWSEPDTLARTQTKGAARKVVPKVGEFALKRGSE